MRAFRILPIGSSHEAYVQLQAPGLPLQISPHARSNPRIDVHAAVVALENSCKAFEAATLLDVGTRLLHCTPYSSSAANENVLSSLATQAPRKQNIYGFDSTIQRTGAREYRPGQRLPVQRS
ncbi:hypothetical protein FVE85_9636 [Porphyridium purpureum]|uniref:Uncharacterized protein n=1 Tax=Porphyridium purpureum TaxID=35688 RepID=A0A5J4YJL7_PORPP|nr:hypothetical protein FVE85_7826 [Porphyridium purpureum]KAA8491589.1 hypothetical protein FVE85_9636 [Porphyridium purpureum]|eukprot:POR8180..scf246_12